MLIARWGYRVVRRREEEPEDLARAVQAANWLDDLSREHGHIAVVTHGNFRRFVTRQLENIGWRGDGKRRSYDHWSIWSLTK